MYSRYFEDWASHGFVVVCVNHSDGSAAVRSPHNASDEHVYYELPPAQEPMKVNQDSRRACFGRVLT